jgi:group I intron endonuclease
MTKDGVYIIRCLSNRRAYVGQSIDIPERFHQHRCHLRSGDHPNPHLQAAWTKYGEDAFVFEVLASGKSHVERDYLEDLWLSRIKAEGTRVFNIRPSSSTNKGVKFSAETKARISAKAVKQFATSDGRKKHSQTYRNSTAPLVLVDALGASHSFDNPSEFARINNLELGSLHKLLRGGLYSYRGWTNPAIDASAKKTCKLSAMQKDEAVSRQAAGETYLQIADSFGVTRGSLWQVVHRRKG